MQNKNQKGFTLIELIVAIAILAILAVGAGVIIMNVTGGAQEQVERAQAADLADSLNRFNDAVQHSTVYRVDAVAAITLDTHGRWSGTVLAEGATLPTTPAVNGIRYGRGPVPGYFGFDPLLQTIPTNFRDNLVRWLVWRPADGAHPGRWIILDQLPTGP